MMDYPNSKTSHIDLSIITVTYQSKEHIDSCILSVVTHILNCSYEHIIVDNGSVDGTVEIIENGYLNYVRLIKNSTNMGFPTANNRAFKEAKGRFILFLNPDMQLHEGWLDDLIAWMDKKNDVGIASCKLLSHLKVPHPSLRPSKFPFLFPYVLSFLKFRPFFCYVNSKFFYSNFDDTLEQEVQIIRGSFILMKRETIEKIGFAFDPKYFILFEDLDLCREVQNLGLKVMYCPFVSCIDYFGKSFSQQTKPWKYLQMQKSFKTYIRKWHSPLHLLWIHIVVPIGFLLRIRDWGARSSWEALISMEPFSRKRVKS